MVYLLKCAHLFLKVLSFQWLWKPEMMKTMLAKIFNQLTTVVFLL